MKTTRIRERGAKRRMTRRDALKAREETASSIV